MAGLKAGTATINITPPVGTYLGGYAGRKGPCVGIHDQLYSKCLVLQQENEVYVIIANDLVGFDAETAEEIKLLIKKKTGIPVAHVTLACSHTHSGPTTYLMGSGDGVPNADYLRFLNKKIAGTVTDALKKTQAAWIGAARGQIRINVSRRGTTPSGSIDLKPNPKGVVDEEVGVLKIVNKERKTVAHLLNYACHAVVLGKNNLLVSADYPGVVQTVTEKVLGGTALFTNGCSGDLNSVVHNGDFTDVERLGRMLAEEVIKASNSIDEFTQPEISLKEEEVVLPWKNPFSKEELTRMAVQEQANYENYQTKKGFFVERDLSEIRWKWAEHILQKMRAEQIEKGAWIKIKAIFLGPLILLMIPAEVLVEIGLKIKKFSRREFTYILSCTDGIMGYIPTEKALKEGGYEAESYLYSNGLPFLPSVEKTLLTGLKKLLE